ncbi:aldo/keto reductase [Klebsiella pneumoniae]|nr:aldo/keto reductase [Klebsiella pneumoniae]
MNFGDVTDEKISARILDEAPEMGINFIDTPDVYGTEQSPGIQQGSGLSEEIIGRWLQQGGRRETHRSGDKSLSAYGARTERSPAFCVSYSRETARTVFDGLGPTILTSIEMHPHRSSYTPWEEIWQAMELLVQQGKVLYIGI